MQNSVFGIRYYFQLNNEYRLTNDENQQRRSEAFRLAPIGAVMLPEALFFEA